MFELLKIKNKIEEVINQTNQLPNTVVLPNEWKEEPFPAVEGKKLKDVQYVYGLTVLFADTDGEILVGKITS